MNQQCNFNYINQVHSNKECDTFLFDGFLDDFNIFCKKRLFN
jgi:hypothetical protein